MKIAEYGKAITSYIESPTKKEKDLLKLRAEEANRTFLADGTPPPNKPKQLKDLFEKINRTVLAVRSNTIQPEFIVPALEELTQEYVADGLISGAEARKFAIERKEYWDKWISENPKQTTPVFDFDNEGKATEVSQEEIIERINEADGGRIGFADGPKKYDYSNPLQKNQYIMRTDEEIQAIIDDPKYKNYTRKDFRNEGILTRKETERETLKFKNFGKKKKIPENKENVKRDEKIKKTQGSNISVRGSGQTGKQFSHVYPLIESAKPGTKTTFVIDAKMNRALEGYNKIGQAIAEAQEYLINTKPDGYKQKIVELNARAKKNVLNAINDLGKEYKGQIGYFQVDPETGEFKPKAGNYKMSFAGIEGENKIYKDMTGKERKDFERKISAIEKAKIIPGVTTADQIDRPEKAKLADKFKTFGKYAKQIAKPVIRVASPFIPIVGTAGTIMGGADVAKAAEQGFTSPDELALAYLAGPEAAKGLDSLKEKVRGQIDETEEFVP